LRDVRGRLLGDLELLRSEFGPLLASEVRACRRELAPSPDDAEVELARQLGVEP
jgi:hypothetical protein